MENKHLIFATNATGYGIYELDGQYFAAHEAEDNVQYKIGPRKNWSYSGQGVKYMTNASKLKLLDALDEVVDKTPEQLLFISKYNEYNVQPTYKFFTKGSKDEPTMENSNEVLSQLLTAIEDLKKPSTLELQMIEAVIAKGADIATADLEQNLIERLETHIKNTYGALPTQIEIADRPDLKPVTGIFHKSYEDLTKMIYGKIPTMLVGPAGSGKNHTLEQIAEALDLDFYFTNAITQEHKLTGFVDAYGTYHETEFYKSFKNGGMFFFDEIDASIADALIIVNAAIANGYFDFPHERIKAHEDFRIVAAANTFGHGADMIYVGRSQLDGATLDRFAVVEFNYDAQVETMLAQDYELYYFVKALREAILEIGLRYTMSTRAIINSRKMVQNGLSIENAIQFGIFKSISKDDLRMIYKNEKMSNLGNSNRWYKASRSLV